MQAKIKKAWTVPVIDVDGELGFELPDDIIKHLDIKVADTIVWEEVECGWMLRKKQNDR